MLRSTHQLARAFARASIARAFVRASIGFGVVALALAIPLVAAQHAGADEIEAKPIAVPAEAEAQTEVSGDLTPAAGATDSDEPLATSPIAGKWHYSTYYLFPLTRHMNESEIPKPWRIPVYPFTALLDVAQLPLGALGGLFGD